MEEMAMISVIPNGLSLPISLSLSLSPSLSFPPPPSSNFLQCCISISNQLFAGCNTLLESADTKIKI